MSTQGRLAGQVALVTGGARGLGEAIVRRFVDEGAKVVIADLLVDEGSALAAEVGARFVALDVADFAAWAAVVADIETQEGRLDCLVNNAGIVLYQRLDDLSEEQIRRTLEVNLLGAIAGTQAVIRLMERQGGSIINISSVDGLIGANALTAYCASKWGLRGFTKAAALELGPRGIRVNSVHPGGIYTEASNPWGVSRELYDSGYWIYPSGRTGEPDHVAGAAVYLASADGAHCFGTELAVDGGIGAGHYYMALPGAPAKPARS